MLRMMLTLNGAPDVEKATAAIHRFATGGCMYSALVAWGGGITPEAAATYMNTAYPKYDMPGIVYDKQKPLNFEEMVVLQIANQIARCPMAKVNAAALHQKVVDAGCSDAVGFLSAVHRLNAGAGPAALNDAISAFFGATSSSRLAPASNTSTSYATKRMAALKVSEEPSVKLGLSQPNLSQSSASPAAEMEVTSAGIAVEVHCSDGAQYGITAEFASHMKSIARVAAENPNVIRAMYTQFSGLIIDQIIILLVRLNASGESDEYSTNILRELQRLFQQTS